MKPRLPIVGSTAATTAFCSARLDGPGGLHLWLDGNGKITAGNGTLTEPQPNAFSLEAEAVAQADIWHSLGADVVPGVQEHCPGATPTCMKACYVGPLSKAQEATYALYRHNSTTIRTILGDPLLADAWVLAMAGWITENAAGGFRWHVSGDVFSLEYARWIADVCRESPTVDHWIYTRSFGFLEPLAEVSTLRGGNLALNLSCDDDNYDTAVVASVRYGRPPWVHAAPTDQSTDADAASLRLCYLTVDGRVPDDLGYDDVIFPDYSLRPRAAASLQDSEWRQSLSQGDRGLVCPVDAHSKSEKIRCGPCKRCLT